METFRKIILWSYERASWQWDVLCLLCLVFIFLTPKTWFDKRERLATQMSRLIVKPAEFSPDKSNFENRVRELSGNANAEIIEWREKKNADGEVFYEIDIR